MLKLILLLIFSLNLQAQNSKYYVRTADSIPADYEAFLTQNHQLSYLDWTLYSLKTRSWNSQSLDQALEKSQTSPLQALSDFENSIRDLTETLMGPGDQRVLDSIYQKIISLEIPLRLQEVYRLKILKRDSVKALTELQKKDVALTLQKIRAMPGFQEALILVDGEELQKRMQRSWPEGERQWVLLSNAYLPILHFGSWNDFQVKIFSEKTRSPLAQGDCQGSHLLVNDFEIQSAAQIFVSKKCPPNLQGGHLVDFIEADETPSRWKWLLPAVTVIGLGLAYSLKDKHVSFHWPSLR